MKICHLIWLSLMGCSRVSETFDSTPGQGVGAQPITVVNHMVDRGDLKGSALSQNNHKLKTHQPIRYIPLESAKRLPEKTMRIWIAPYIDAQGHLHEGSYVHTIIQPCDWGMPSHMKGDT